METQIEGKSPLYEKLALELSRQIESGTFRPGERIPSVRHVSRQRELSVTTVLQAYRVLEDRGLIEARPQSGYYVRRRMQRSVPEPEISSPPSDPCHVSMDEMVSRILKDAFNPNLIQFGAAIPAPDLLPGIRLNRILANIIRSQEIPPNVYGTPEGLEELRVHVAKKAFIAGAEAKPDDVIITNGCMEAIGLSLRTVCHPGDLVAIESPTYFGILYALESQGLRALEIPTHPRDGISLEALRFAIEHHPVRACVIVPNFNNPLGSCMPEEHKRELVELLAQKEIPLIEDDINGEIFFDGERPKLARAYDKKGLVLTCSSFTKDIAPSYRIGWCLPGRFRDNFKRLKMATNMGTAILPQLAIARFLESGGYDHHLRTIRRAYAEKVAGMTQAILRYFPEETRVTSPKGGIVLWVQMPEHVDSLELYSRALKANITLAPGYIFSPTPKYKNFIRLNAAYWSFKAERAIQILGELVEQAPKD